MITRYFADTVVRLKDGSQEERTFFVREVSLYRAKKALERNIRKYYGAKLESIVKMVVRRV